MPSGLRPGAALLRARSALSVALLALLAAPACKGGDQNDDSGKDSGDASADAGQSDGDSSNSGSESSTGGDVSLVDTGFDDESPSGEDGDNDDGDAEAGGEGALPKFDLGGVPDGLPPSDGGDPRTCAEATINRTYVGCEFWPTITYNPVLENFHFAAVVANGNDKAAEVVVERDGTMVETVTIEPGSLKKIFLPWVDGLKGPQFAANTTGARPKTSTRVNGGAYKLESDLPVSVWQFNPLEYQMDPGDCALKQNLGLPGEYCYSVSNDAALLIPQTAMTGSYRVFIKDSAKGTDGGYADTPSSLTITATRDNTTVRVKLPPGKATEGGGVPAIDAGGEATYELNAGDVIQLLGKHGKWDSEPNVDLSGTLVTAMDANPKTPIQVIASVALTAVPSPQLGNTGFADHLEETMLPTEVLGKRYLVTPNTSSQGENIGHYVRIYGNFDDTALDYPSGKPTPDAPDVIQAGEVYDIDTDESFEVVGSESFAVGLFVRGGQLHTPNALPTEGDPAFSLAVAVEQFRSRYIFLAPNDYDQAFADIIMEEGADLRLNGMPLTATPEAIGSSGWVLVREPLGAGNDGAHLLEAADPDAAEVPRFGLQVMGYGHATGYMYPGGLNLDLISDPPPG